MGKRLVIGLGESGMAMVRHAVRASVSVAVYDTRESPAQLSALRERYPDVVAHCSTWQADFLNDVAHIAVSPGLSPHAEPLHTILAQARERGIAVLGEVMVFAQALAQLADTHDYHPKVLAITGTNGKTTTTALTRHLCVQAGVNAVAAGNISPSMLDALCDALDVDELPQVWVLELSSFQLQLAQDFNPDAATVLNLSQDHLDWHADMDEYAQAKARVFGASTVQVLNRDDIAVMAMVKPDSARLSFGIDTPVKDGQYGLLNEGSMVWLAYAQADTEHEPKKKRGEANPAPATVAIHRLMPMDALQIRGRHNAMNALAALALCRTIDLPLAKLLHGLRTYTGEPHRVQWLQNINGVDFYDDSKGTNVGATLAAIEGLGQDIVLIAGGDGKGQDFAPLAQAVKTHVRHVCLIGQDAGLIQTAWADTGVPIEIFGDLTAATRRAAERAQNGQAVLLSPACASLDMFRNYAHRAQVFADAVRDWAHEHGQV